MSDVYTQIGDVSPAILGGLMTALELRAADPQQRAMLDAYLAAAAIQAGARVLEVGCGTGAVTRVLAAWPGVARAIGVDPSPAFVARARDLTAGLASLSFGVADGRSLPFAPNTFDMVVFHTTLCHVLEPEVMLQEALRVLQPGGCLAVFDGDYATSSVAMGVGDPLQSCVDAFREHFIHDPWLVRRLRQLVHKAGGQIVHVRSYSYVEGPEPGFMLSSWMEMGADALVTAGQIGTDLAEALKEEARQRVASGRYFGTIAYMSIVARKAW